MKAAVLQEESEELITKIFQNISKKVKFLQILFVKKESQLHHTVCFNRSSVPTTSWPGSLKILCPGAASDSPSGHRTAPHSAP